MKTTEPFMIPGPYWKLVWRTYPEEWGNGYFGVVVVPQSNPTATSLVANVMGEDCDSTFREGPGAFSLEISSTQKYTLSLFAWVAETLRVDSVDMHIAGQCRQVDNLGATWCCSVTVDTPLVWSQLRAAASSLISLLEDSAPTTVIKFYPRTKDSICDWNCFAVVVREPRHGKGSTYIPDTEPILTTRSIDWYTDYYWGYPLRQ